MENLIPALNKETKNQALMLKIDASCYFHILPPEVYLQDFPYWGEWWGSSPTSRKFAHPPPPPPPPPHPPPPPPPPPPSPGKINYPSPSRLPLPKVEPPPHPPHSIIIFMLKSNKNFIFNCSHCSCTILILTLYSLYAKVMLIWF